MQKHYTVYKTTNTVNDKFYIGQHQTFDLADTYLGSGTAIKRAIKKYGCDLFIKEVLHVFDNFDEMNAAEQALVTEEVVSNPMCYNQVIGGQTANLSRKQTYVRTAEHCKALSESKTGKKQDPLDVERRAKTCKVNRANMSQDERNARFGHKGMANGFYNKTHSDISKQKIKDTIGSSRQGGNNSNAKPVTMYGKQYSTKKECYTDLGISKKKLNQQLKEFNMKNIRGES